MAKKVKKKRVANSRSSKTSLSKPQNKPATSRSKEKQYWLMKSEPSGYSIDDLAAEPSKTTHWDGVRNYQARNFMRDQMKKKDVVLFYHSNAKPPAVVGIAEIVRESYPDFTAFDPQEKHYDPKSKHESPTWMMVDIKLKRKFKRPLSLTELRSVAELKEMELLRKGSRLSIQPVRKQEFDTIVKLAAQPAQ